MFRRRQAGLTPPFPRSLALALALLVAAPAAPALLAEEGTVAAPAPAPAPAAQSRPAAERPAPAPDPDRLRRRVDHTISLDELFAAESRTDLGKAPVAFRCEEVGTGSTGPAAIARRVNKPTILDPRWLCYGACMLICLGDGAPYGVCDEVCSDICFHAVVAEAPAPPEGTSEAPAEPQPAVARAADR